MKVVKKEAVKTVFTVELDQDEVGFIAVILGGATGKYYSENVDYISRVTPEYTNEMASHLFMTFKGMFEGGR